MLEKDIQKQLIGFCKRKGFLAFKTESASTRGFPDLLVIEPNGKISLVEVKTPTGKLSQHQIDLHKTLKEFKVSVLTVTSLEEFKEKLKC